MLNWKTHQATGPTVSAIVPAYNSSTTIRDTLRSIYAQTYPHIIEVIVVDDGSTDDTPAIIAREFPEVILIRQENAGGAAARNTGARRATGDYLALLDHDDQWLPHKIETQVRVMAEHPEIALATCLPTHMDCGQETNLEAPGTRSEDRPYPLQLTSFRDWLYRTQKPFFPSCSGWLVRARVFHEVGGLDESIWPADDWEFLLRLAGLGFGVTVLTEALVAYNRNGFSKSAAGRLVYCSCNLEIIRRYDPAGEGWQSELLTPEEYRAVLHDAYFHRAWGAWELGERDLAREYLREARKLAPPGLRSGWRHRLAAWRPGLYRALSRARPLTREKG